MRAFTGLVLTKGWFVLKILFVRFQKYLDAYGRDLLNCLCAVLNYADVRLAHHATNKDRDEEKNICVTLGYFYL